MNPAYSVILPAYNEELSIERAVRETAAVMADLHLPYEIIAVDDGSADRTGLIIASLAREITALKPAGYKPNRGKGAAVAAGVATAQGERIIFLDCDLATHPNEIARFIGHESEADILIGSRQVAGAVIAKAQPSPRAFSGRIINSIVRHLLGLPYRDTQCGFKMFRREAARTVFAGLEPCRWLFDVQLLVRAREAGLTVKELPITWNAHRVSRVKVKEVLADLYWLWRGRRFPPPNA